jgi:hypothetical protein
MADNTQIKWLYPPNFPGTYDSHIKNGVKRHVILCTNKSDGTGEDDAIKLKRTDLLTPSGNIPSKLVIEKIEYDISGMEVLITYNNDNDEEVARLYNSSGVIDFRYMGGFVPMDEEEGEIPEGGDIVFTTDGATDGDSYNITLTVRLKD